jgi:hypothetical protein
MRFNILQKIRGSGSSPSRNRFAYIAWLNDIVKFPKADYRGVVLMDDIEMKENTGMMQIYLTSSSQEYSYETIGDPDSKIFKVKFTGTHPGTEQEALEFVQNFMEEPFIVLIPSCETGVKVLGNPDAPMVFTSSHKSGKDGDKFIFNFEQEIGSEIVYQLYTGVLTLNNNIEVDMADFLEQLKQYMKLDGTNLTEAQKSNLRNLLGLGENIANSDLTLESNRNFNVKNFFLNFISSTGLAKIGFNKNNPEEAVDVSGNVRSDGLILNESNLGNKIGSIKRKGNSLSFNTSNGEVLTQYEDSVEYFSETTKWYDGSPMTDDRVDNDIFIKKDGKFLQKTISKETFLKIGTISELRQTNGYYEGQEIILLGYYESGDKDPVHYKYTVQHYNSAVDNGGLTIKTDRGVWVAQFQGKCDVKDFGAVKDIDCTAIINTALQLVDHVIISERYLVFGTGYEPTTTNTTFRFLNGIKPRSGNTLERTRNGLLELIPNAENFSCCLNLHRINNVKLINVITKGDVETHLGTTGEWGYGVSIRGCEDISLINCKSTHFWGDGLNLGPSKLSATDLHQNKNIRIINNFEANYCRRNGIALESCDGFFADKLIAKFNGTINGINPKYGLDVEPNNGGNDKIVAEIGEVYTEGNGEGGTELIPAYMQDIRYTTTGIYDVKIGKITSVNDGVITENRGCFRIAGSDLDPVAYPNTVETKRINGSIEIGSIVIDRPNKRAIQFTRLPATGLNVNIDSISVLNPVHNLDITNSKNFNETNNAVSFTAHSLQQTFGNININNLYVLDPDGILREGVYFKAPNETDRLFENVNIRNYKHIGQWVETTEVPTYGAVGKTVSIRMATPVKINIDATNSMHNYSVVDEMEIDLTTTNVLLALNNTNVNKRRRYKLNGKTPSGTVCYVKGRNSAQPITVTPRSSETIAVAADSTVTIEVDNDGTWKVIDYAGSIYNDNFRVRGATANRPTGLTTSNTGFQYFDTSLKSYVYWNGSKWVTDLGTDYQNITVTSYNFTPNYNIKTFEFSGTTAASLTVSATDLLQGLPIFLRNNVDFNVRLISGTGVKIFGVGDTVSPFNPYNQVVMSRKGESILLYSDGLNSWRWIALNKIAGFVSQISTANASDLSTAIQLANDCKMAINAILQTAIDSGQRASS